MTAVARIGSLFSGYGGLEMGVQAVVGGAVAWHAENDTAACRVLAYRYPGIPNLGDITAVDWSSVKPVDVLTGGFPCQDLSLAGHRAGLRAGNRSGLWTVMADAVEALRPALVVAENVRGLLSSGADSDVEPCPWCLGDAGAEPTVRALGVVLGDLADLGYDAAWHGLRATDVGAPHSRFRIFLAAWPATTDPARLGHERGGAGWLGRSPDRDRGRPSPARASRATWGIYSPAVARWEGIRKRPAPVPAISGTKGQPKPNPVFVEWMMGLPEGWVTAVPGLTVNEQLRMLGNGVVPQQAAAALAVLRPLVGAA